MQKPNHRPVPSFTEDLLSLQAESRKEVRVKSEESDENILEIFNQENENDK
jgi:hypothetical protein